MREIYRSFIEWPFLGVRQLRDYLAPLGFGVGRKRVRRLMRLMGLMGCTKSPKPASLILSIRGTRICCGDCPSPGQPDLVRGHHVHPHHAQRLPVPSGRYGLAQQKGIVLEAFQHHNADFCAAALEEALAKHGKPDIFNTDQGSQFISVLRDNNVRISMDGRGCWLDNVFIERLWRSLQYECVYLHAFETGSETRSGIGGWIGFYNRLRPRSSPGGLPPDRYHEQALAKAA